MLQLGILRPYVYNNLFAIKLIKLPKTSQHEPMVSKKEKQM